MKHGSSWARWDVHIHAPGTAAADEFGGAWEEYLTLIEGNADVIALGVTDYCTTRTYEAVQSHRAAGRLKNIRLLFPNIEFRLTTETRQGKGINIHLLVSPDEPDHVARLNESLSRLITEGEREKFPCTPEGLRRLGRRTDAGLDDNSALQAGVERFKVDLSSLRTWYRSEPWLQRNALVAVASGTNDGTSGLRHDDGFKEIRRQIQEFAHIMFSANPGDREYFAGKGADDVGKLWREHGGPMPCLHGSDAHGLDRVLAPDLGRCCWIKGDPNFETLRQTLWEPLERVHIGPTAPGATDPDTVLSTLRLTETQGWFDEPLELHFSPQLTAIIGPRGSGKTAVADLIAIACGAGPGGESSFVSKARDHIDRLEARAIRFSGRTTGGRVEDCCETWDEPDVQYLSQQFVEDLCSSHGLADKLIREVERVVFNSIPQEQRLNCADFDDLRRKRTERVRDRREAIRLKISGFSGRIHEIKFELSAGPQRKRDLAKAKTEATRLAGEIGKLPKASKEADALLKQLTELQREETHISENIAKLHDQRRTLTDLRAELAERHEEFSSYLQAFRDRLKDLGVPSEQLARYTSSFAGDTREPFTDLLQVFDNKVARLSDGGEEKPPPRSLVRVRAEIGQVQNKLKLDGQQTERIERLKRALSKAEADVARYAQELERLVKLRAELDQCSAERLSAYQHHFILLAEERTILAELYAPLVDGLAARGDRGREVGFSIDCKVDVSNWARTGEALLDRRRTGRFRESGSIRDYALENLVGLWRSCDSVALGTSIGKLVADLPTGSDLVDSLREGATPQDLADWVFSVNHIRLDYGLTYQGVSLDKLSPGTRGVVLLILYLALDTADRRPLLIDQPEENLDNESVFEVLVGYFREAKTRRQIIIVSHNPNLVVNADAEQVIVASSVRRASGLPSISYESGAIESRPVGGEAMKERICRILEGGRQAFDMRRRKYHRVDPDAFPESASQSRGGG